MMSRAGYVFKILPLCRSCLLYTSLTENGFRDKVLLAGFPKDFFGKEEVAEWIEELNATEITHNFTLEPGVWMAPVVLENKNGSARCV